MEKDDEKDLFKKAMKGVTPLKKTTQIPSHLLHQKKKFKKKSAKIPATIQHEFYEEEENWVSGEEPLFFGRSGISPATIKKMKKFKRSHSDWLDLHRMPVEAALHATHSFIQSAIRHGSRHIGIIHGKGYSLHKPKIKNVLNIWLKEQPEVLAFVSANKNEGGTGAIYVLLSLSK